MRKLQLKLWLFTLLLAVGGVSPAWAQDTTTLLEYGTTDAPWTTEGLATWTAGGTPTLADGIVTIFGGNGSYATSKTIAPAEGSIINVTAVWRGRSNTGRAFSAGNGSYFRFGNIVVAQNDQDQKHGYIFTGLSNIGSVTTFTAGSYRTDIANCTWLKIEAEINTATNTLTSFTIKSEDGNTTYVNQSNVALSSPDYTTVAFGYQKGGGVSTTNTEQLKSIKITETTQSVSYADYIVHFVDNNGAKVKEDVVRTGVPESTANATDEDKTTFYADGYKYVYSNDGGGVTIASDGTSEFTVTYNKYGKYSATASAVNGETTLIEELASGEAYEDETITLYLNKYIKVDGVWYSTNTLYVNATATGNTPVSYTPSDIDYFFECEDMNLSSTYGDLSNSTNVSGGKARGVTSKANLRTTEKLPAGKYNISLYGYVRRANEDKFMLQYSADGTEWTDITELTFASSVSQIQTAEGVVLTEDSYIRFVETKEQNACHYLDYVTVTLAGVDYTVEYKSGEVVVKESVVRSGKPGTIPSLLDSDKEDVVLENVKYVYSSDNASEVTVAADGSTVVTVNFNAVNRVNYTVNATDGTNTLGVIATGSAWQGESVKVAYPAYFNVNGTLYKKDATKSEYRQDVEITEADQVTDFVYTASDITGIVYYAEAENIEGMSTSTVNNVPTRSSNAKCGYSADDITIVNLPAGIYKLTAYVYKNNSGVYTYTFTAGENTIAAFVQNGASNGSLYHSDEFTLSAATDIVLKGGTSDRTCVDYIYIQKTGEYVEPATANYHVYKEGVEVAAGTDYFLYNLGAKKFLDNGMDWGTHATVDKSGRKITFAALADGKYSIYTQTYSLNNNAEAKSGYMTTNGYCDTGTNDANWEFTPVSVDGYTNVYTIKNSDTQYLIYNSEDARVNVGESTNDNNSYWIIVPKSARDAVNDVTYLLMNTDFNRPWERAVWSGSTGTNDKFTTGGAASNRCGEKYHAVFDLYQNIAATPANGKYVLHAQGFYRLDGGSDPAYLYINDDKVALKVFNGEGEGTVANMDGASASFSAGLYKSEVTSIVTNNTMRVGIKNDNAENWLIWDNFYLEYLGTTLINDAVALPEGGAMEAGKWYYIDIAAAANNYMATATTLSDIIYTTDGTMLTADAAGVTNHFTAEDNTLTAGRHYVMSTTANSLEISIPSFTYTVGTAVASQNYIQTGNVVTVTYADLATNNPDVKEATIDFSGVTFGGNAQQVTPTANGFTFTVPAVTANTEYTLAIPAGAIGYAEGDTYNEAQNIVVKTPALLDGTYFLKVENETAAKGKYLARGRSYGTHATVDKYGLPIVITTNSDNVSTLMASDTRRFYYHGDSWDCWADNTNGSADVAKFTITLADGKYRIHSNAMADGTYLKYNNTNVNDENIPVYDDGTGSNSGPIIDWSVELPAEHATVMQAMKDAQAATAAAAAYASGDYESLNGITTVAALEAELTANYIKGDFVAPSPIESISEKYQGDVPASSNTMETVYSNSIEITKAGFYKFSMQAFYRAASNEVTQAMHTAGVDFPPVFLFFGDAQTQIKSVYDDGGIAQEDFETETVGGAPVEYNGKYYTNGQHNSVIVFQKNYYHNDVWVYISEPGTYNYGVKYTGFANANSQWFIYSPESVTITSYAAAATDDDYTAMNTAIENAKAKTLGFDENEYAPYNNIANIEAIATAEAINQEATNSQLLIRSLTETLNNWTMNNADVDAVYNGSFATVTEGANYPKGWTRTNGWGEMESGLAGDYATAYYNQPGSLVYGNTGSYTMPLNENTLYKLTIAYRSHADNSNNGLTVSVLKDEEGLAATKFAANGSKTDWVVVTKYFTTGAAGNYVLTLNNDGNTWMTGVSITKAQAEDITISEEETYAASTTTERYGNVTFNRTLVEGWNGLVLPFDMTVENVATTFKASKVKNFIGITYEEAKGVTLNFDNFAAETVIPAGTPFLVKAAAGTSYTINGVVLPANGLQNITKTADGNDKIKYTMKGTHAASTNLTDVSFALIQGNTFFYHDGAAAKASSAKAFRAYFENESEEPVAARVSFDFGDGETTGITELAQPKTAADGTYYDLQGRKVENFKQKGIYIVNGRKVVK